MTARTKVLIVEDDSDDREAVREALEGFDFLELDIVPPPGSLDKVGDLVGRRPEVILVDYQLSEKEEDRETANYKGSTLGAAIREKVPTLPIVLITRATMERSGHVNPARDVFGAFDEFVVKDKIYDRPEVVAHELRRLAVGFKRLTAAKPKDWGTLRKVIGARPGEDDLLRSARPPSALLGHKAWRVVEIARWIRQTLIQFPGVLVSPLHAACTLGINVESLGRRSVLDYLKDSLYKGVFAPSPSYFWKLRLADRARRLLREVELAASPLTHFSEAWSKRFPSRKKLGLAVCNTSRRQRADSVCYLLQEPVLREYSLPYRPDERPAVMEGARISFKAIRTKDDYEEHLFPPDARSVLRAVQRESDVS